MIERKSQSTVKPKEVTIRGDKVLVAENITEELMANDMGDSETLMYKYDENVYSKDEYIILLKNENNNLKETVDTLVLESLGL